MNISLSILRRSSIVLATLIGLATGNACFAIPVTPITTLTVSPGSVPSGTAVTLQATVVSSVESTPYTSGYVAFCDATAATCEGSALIATAAVNTSGVAQTKVTLGIGTHSIKAVYGPFPGYNSSTSTTQAVTVTGTSQTTTLISQGGTVGAYTLKGTVNYMGLAPVTAGEAITFIDTTNSNLNLASATLGAVAAPLYNFITPATSPVTAAALPFSMAIGDFNNDGYLDLAVGNYAANSVILYKGNAQGQFTQLATFSVPTPGAIALADFDRNGFLDIAVVDTQDHLILTFGNLGDGFSLTNNIDTQGMAPTSITAMDFNGDGAPDVVVTNQWSSNYLVLTGDGSGLLSPASPVSTGGNPGAVVVADFNGDGRADIAIANTYDGTVSIELGAGNGTFSDMPGSPFVITGSSTPSGLAVGDFDGDGRPDLAILDSTNNLASFLLNKVSGPALAGAPIATGVSPQAAVVGDFNGDGKQDVAIANAGDSTVIVLQGDGTGNFTAQTPLTGFNAAETLAGLDINSDGLQDLAIANGGSRSFSLRQMSVTQTASTPDTAVSVYGNGLHAVTAAYGGDSSYVASTSTPISLTASTIPTTSTLSVSPQSSVLYGATVQLTDIITPPSANHYAVSGTVTFKDGATTIGTATVSNGQGLLSVNSLAIGNHTITATYSGDTNFASSVSNAAPLTVTSTSVAVTLSASTSSIVVGGSISFTAALTPGASGTVSFYDGTTLLGSSTVNGSQAIFSTSSLAVGTHTITATYNGDTTHSPATSTAVSVTIADFTLSVSSGSGGGSSGTPSSTVLPGGTATFTLSLGPSAGTVFPVPVTLSLSGLPPGATGTLSPTVLPAGSGLSTVTLTIQVPKTTSAMHDRQLLERTAAPVVLAFLLLPFSGRIRRKTRGLNRVLLLLLLMLGTAGVVGLSGCSSGNGYFGQAQKTYAITITATAGTVSHSTQVNLTVQ